MITAPWWVFAIGLVLVAVAVGWVGWQLALRSVDADMDALFVTMTKAKANIHARKPCLRCGALARDDGWAIEDRWTWTDDGWICRWCAGDEAPPVPPDVEVRRFAIAGSRVVAFCTDAGADHPWTVTSALNDRGIAVRAIPADDLRDALKVARLLAAQELCEGTTHAGEPA